MSRTLLSSLKVTSSDSLNTPEPFTFAQVQSLDSLPPELKARVAFFACVQDREYKERWSKGHFGSAVVKELQNETHGKSVHALALVNQTFRQLCAKHIFQTIDAARMTGSFFRTNILPRHGARVQAVDLSGALPDATNALNLLSSLPNLKELHINDRIARHLLGDLLKIRPGHPAAGGQHPDDDPERLTRQRVRFYAIAAQLPRVRLNFFSRETLVPLLWCFRALRVLRLQSHGPEPTLPEDLAWMLSELPLLTELNLRSSSPWSINPKWANEDWPALTTVTLRKVRLEPALFAFLGAIAPALETLHITFSTREPTEQIHRPLFTTAFPSLAHLSLTNLHSSAAREALESLKSSRLQSLDLRLRKHARVDNQTFISSIRAFRPTLVLLTVMLQSGRRISTLAKRFVLIPGIIFRGGVEQDPFLTRKEDEMVNDKAGRMAAVEERANALVRTLVFGIGEVERMRAEGNTGEMEKAFRALEKLKVWQMVVEG